MSKPMLTVEQTEFIDAFAVLMGGFNMPNNAARLYGYLHLRNEPASLDDIVRDLRMSKSNVWSAGKTLEARADVRRVTEAGTKRVSYVAGDDPGAPLRRQGELLGMTTALILEQKDRVATGEALLRLERLAEFHKELQRSMQDVIKPVKAI